MVQVEKSSDKKQSPETYLGSSRETNFQRDFITSPNLLPNHWTPTGMFFQEKEYIISNTPSDFLTLNFSAKDVYLVLGGSGTIRMTVNGKVKNPGTDVKDGIITVNSDRMYHLVHSENFEQNQLLKLEFSPGIRAYAFTFGS